MTRLALLTVLVAAALAGCAIPGDLPTNASDAMERLSDEQARELLAAASALLPERFGYSIAGAAPNGTRLLTMDGLRDNATGETYASVEGAAALLNAGGSNGGNAAAMARFAPLLSNGIVLYGAPEGALYLVNGTAFVFAGAPSSLGNQVPNPGRALETSPYSPDALLALLVNAGLEVTGITTVNYDGRPAARIDFQAPHVGETVRGHAVVTVADQRVAQIAVTNPDPASPVEQIVADFRYGEDAGEIPEEVRGALRLGYASDANPLASMFRSRENATTTWTFLAATPVALDGLEIVAKGGASGGVSSLDLRAAPTLWSMPLVDGERTEGNVTVTFTDADGDGMLGAGDRVTIGTTGGATAPRLALRDANADLHVLAPVDLVQAFLGA